MARLLKALVLLLLLGGIAGGFGYFWFTTKILPERERQAYLAEQEAAGARAAVTPPDPGLPKFEEASARFAKGDLPGAASAWAELLDNFPRSARVVDARQRLGEAHSTMLFSPAYAEGKTEYVVQKGDALVKIERTTGATAELLMRLNNLDDIRKLQIGQRLVYPTGIFSLEIRREDGAVTLLRDGFFFREFPAASSKLSASTFPEGHRAKVTGKIVWKDGKQIALGERDYLAGTRWVQIASPGLTLAGSDGALPPGPHVLLAPEAVEEIHTLIGRHADVTFR